tara:strand:- start:18 stop:302 length:285 start_codon:yes stop_codon:yes gene_type:complete
MNLIYKKLMEQHGGSIPFTILGGVKEKLDKTKTIRQRKKKYKKLHTKRQHTKKYKNKTKKRIKLNPNNYSVGTIIRINGSLVKLTKNKNWKNIS